MTAFLLIACVRQGNNGSPGDDPRDSSRDADPGSYYKVVTKGDKAETVYVLVLTHELDAAVSNDFGKPAAVEGIEVLIVLPGKEGINPRDHIDGEVVAKGDLVFAVSPHHHTKVLLVTKSIEIQ